MSLSRTSKEFERFAALTRSLLAVPRADVERRLVEYRKEATKDPRERGRTPRHA